MQQKNNKLKSIKMNNYLAVSCFLIFTFFSAQAQEKDSIQPIKTNQQKIKVDGVAVVVGKNIVLDSDIGKFKKELEQRSEGKVKISDCEILEEIMTQKLLAHHAVVDSVKVTDAEVNTEVQRTIEYFKQQLGSMDKVVAMYGFNDEQDLRRELFDIQKEQLLIRKERSNIIEKVDVTPEEVRNYFNNLQKNKNLPEFSTQIELAQITKKVEPTQAEIDRVVAKLKEIKKEVEAGQSFKLKAIINSDDPAVSGNGPGSGGLYTITRESNFIKEFKEVAFSLDEGEISEPFESPYGYHILQVEKIRGQERDVRHILIQPKIGQAQLDAAKKELEDVRNDILSGKITFEAAVLKYSDDAATKNNKGLIINPQTSDTKFDLTRMDPSLYGRVSNLKTGEITQPFYDEVPGESKVYKIILMKNREEAHTADFTKDYEKIQQLALQKKQDETIDKWAADKIKDTYIKINAQYKKCKFKNNWTKE